MCWAVVEPHSKLPANLGAWRDDILEEISIIRTRKCLNSDCDTYAKLLQSWTLQLYCFTCRTGKTNKDNRIFVLQVTQIKVSAFISIIFDYVRQPDMVKVVMSVNDEILSACHSVFGTLRLLHWKVPRPRPSWGAVWQQVERLKIKEWLLRWKISVDDSFFFLRPRQWPAAGWRVRALNDRKQSANLVSFLISGENTTVRMLWRVFFFSLTSLMQGKVKSKTRILSSLFFYSESNKTSAQNLKIDDGDRIKALATVVCCSFFLKDCCMYKSQNCQLWLLMPIY